MFQTHGDRYRQSEAIIKKGTPIAKILNTNYDQGIVQKKKKDKMR